MTATDAGEISAMLTGRMVELAEHLIGSPPTMRTRSTVRFYPRGGLIITVAGKDRGLWCSHGDGGIGGDALDLVKHLRSCSMKEAIAWAQDWLCTAPAPEPRRAPQEADTGRAETDRAHLALKTWAEAIPPQETPVAAYLASRGLSLPPDGPIRFHPACRRGAETLPAMISLMTDPVTAKPCGIHRTFLRPDGGGKIEHGKAKMMLGPAGIIRLVPDDEITTGLGIAEGIETALAIMRHAGWSPVWACGSAGEMQKLPVLAGIESLTIFPDLDDKGAGINAARNCAERWRGAGRDVTIIKPPAGRDWLDALTRQEAA